MTFLATAEPVAGLDISTIGFLITSVVAALAVAIPLFHTWRVRRRQGLDD